MFDSSFSNLGIPENVDLLLLCQVTDYLLAFFFLLIIIIFFYFLCTFQTKASQNLLPRTLDYPGDTFSFLHCFFVYLFIYLFLAALGLCFCMPAFSSCGKRGLFFVAVRGLLIVVASLVAEYEL